MRSSLVARPGPAEKSRLLEGLAQRPDKAARFLLGQFLVRRVGRRVLVARVVETEAYWGETDPASHAFRGKTKRTAPLWGPPGTIYVYFVYGMYDCLNFSVDHEGVPGGVLVRAAEPVDSSGLGALSCQGPGRLCRTLHIDTRDSGRHPFSPRSKLYLREGVSPAHVGVSPRIGVRFAADRPLRFFDADSPAVSATRIFRRPRARWRRRSKEGRFRDEG